MEHNTLNDIFYILGTIFIFFSILSGTITAREKKEMKKKKFDDADET